MRFVRERETPTSSWDLKDMGDTNRGGYVRSAGVPRCHQTFVDVTNFQLF